VDGADSSGVGFRLESSQEQLPTSIAGVLRLRAMKPSVSDRSAKRFAQDDDFVVSGNASLRACDFFDLFVFSAYPNHLYFKPPDKNVILSGAPHRSIA
jgi:hypothetical protein